MWGVCLLCVSFGVYAHLACMHAELTASIAYLQAGPFSLSPLPEEPVKRRLQELQAAILELLTVRCLRTLY